jgi:hypothetical protein
LLKFSDSFISGTKPVSGPLLQIYVKFMSFSFQNTQVDLVALLTKQLSKSNVEDVLPSLALTPRGTGAGYGVGVDLDSLIAGPYTERYVQSYEKKFVS